MGGQAYTWAKRKELEDKDDFSELVDSMCSPTAEEGKWIRRLDLVSKGFEGPLYIKKKDEDGHCGKECGVLRSACLMAIKGKESTLASMLAAPYSDDQEQLAIDTLVSKICKTACNQ